MSHDPFEGVQARASLLASLPPVEEREEARKSLGVSISELAKMVGCSRKYIVSFEKGESVPKGDVLTRLSNFYEASQGRYVVI